MLKLKILSIGKTKEKWLEEACQEYEKRLKAFVHIELLWARDNAQLIDWALKENASFCLDPAGRSLSSEAFSAFLATEWEKGGSRLAIVIGGAEGLPKELKAGKTLISLSPMTFTHQITRLVLMEQIYRAMEIQKGTSYHK